MENIIFIEFLEGELNKLSRKKDINHTLMLVKSTDNSFCWKNTYGESLSTDTPFWIASITKMFISSIVLLLMEEGKLTLNDQIIRYLPEKLIKDVHVINGIDYFDQLTIHHLLKHASGIPD
ncbi:MAG: serine hydrolase domain-containing protein, partial [Acholeplasmataceae bacterium]|nr:serine hydrolase domain-containing protein [Acholeplasmataceae bacterium]